MRAHEVRASYSASCAAFERLYQTQAGALARYRYELRHDR
jgi:hypothetical protein